MDSWIDIDYHPILINMYEMSQKSSLTIALFC